jgi:DNA invertase Pin-like site-specific DNA recombinase
MAIAIYRRVSSKKQDTRSQARDLDEYRKKLEAEGHTVVEFEDKFTGKTMSRPGWDRLFQGVTDRKVERIVVWRLDRLGRTVSGLAKLFEDLIERKVSLISLKDSLDLGTASGRLMAHVLASVAAYETEVRLERQLAGMAVAREKGVTWGGRKVGTRITLTEEKEAALKRMEEEGKSISEIARVLGLTRQTIYRALGRWKRGSVTV